MTQVKQYLTWDQTTYPIQWDNNPYTWDEVFILLEVAQVSGGHGYGYGYQKLEKEKKKKLIKLIAKVRGEEFKEEKYVNEDVDVIAKDIEIVINEVLGAKVKKVD